MPSIRTAKRAMSAAALVTLTSVLKVVVSARGGAGGGDRAVGPVGEQLRGDGRAEASKRPAYSFTALAVRVSRPLV